MFGVDQIVYALATLFALWLSYRSGSCALLRTGWAMTGNLIAVWIAINMTNSDAPWFWFILIDATSAYVISAKPAFNPQAYIFGIYIVQIVVSVVFGAASSPADTRLYLDILAFGGVCQLLILATGAIHGRGGKMAFVRHYIGNHRRPNSANATRLEPGP